MSVASINLPAGLRVGCRVEMLCKDGSTHRGVYRGLYVSPCLYRYLLWTDDDGDDRAVHVACVLSILIDPH